MARTTEADKPKNCAKDLKIVSQLFSTDHITGKDLSQKVLRETEPNVEDGRYNFAANSGSRGGTGRSFLLHHKLTTTMELDTRLCST